MFKRSRAISLCSPIVLALLLTFFALSTSPLVHAQNWGTPVWSDEFSGPLGTPINSANWTYDTGILQVNDEIEYYCSPGMTTGGCNSTNPNAYLDGNDHLIIQAIRLNPSTLPNSGSWTSARLITKGLQTFQYGRIESRMSLPVGPGVWPAFWGLGTNIDSVGWPASGENDVMENVPLTGGLGPTAIQSTIHGNTTSGEYGLGQKFTFPTGDVTGMHTYGTIWSPGMIQFYVDDPSKVFFVRTADDLSSDQTWTFDHAFFLLLNLAIGGDGSWPGPADATTPSPAVMTVDFVRVYKAAAVTAPTFANPPSITVKAGATTGNSSTFTLGNSVGTGRVYLSCTTNAPKASCAISTTDSLSPHTLDFSTNSSGSATATLTTTPNTSAAIAIPGVTLLRDSRFWLLFLSVIALLAAFRMAQSRMRPVSALGICLFLAGVMLLGCGGGSGSTPPPPGNGTTPGSYTITVNAYTVSATGTTPDATVSIPVTVN